MIGKCKAIAHGSTALDYIFREGKLGYRLAFHNLCSRDPKTIYEEMKMVSEYNTRCRNKFLRYCPIKVCKLLFSYLCICKL